MRHFPSDLIRRARIPLIALLLILGWSLPALAEKTVDSIQPIVISDDIMKRTTSVESAATGSEGGEDEVAAAGKTNHGHGNNADGVDSSNPSQGKGGPNGEADASCDGSGDCVDDESKGGGSVMSKGN